MATQRTADLQGAGITQQKTMFGERQQVPVLVPADGRRRVATDDTLKYRHAADGQCLVLRSVPDDWRWSYVAVYNRHALSIVRYDTILCI